VESLLGRNTPFSLDGRSFSIPTTTQTPWLHGKVDPTLSYRRPPPPPSMTSWLSSSRSSVAICHTPSEAHQSRPKSIAAAHHKAKTTFMDRQMGKLKSQFSNSLVDNLEKKTMQGMHLLLLL
jgi:hypothetical protein